jgi:hypothetical protein
MADLFAVIQAQAAFFELYKETKRYQTESESSYDQSFLMLCLISFRLKYRLAEKFRPLENTSATHIQRLFRGTRIRIDIKIKR